MSTRVYKVTDNQTGESVFVEAASQGQAVRYVSNKAYKVKTATSLEVAKAMKEGVQFYSAAKAEEKKDEPAGESSQPGNKQLGGE